MHEELQHTESGAGSARPGGRQANERDAKGPSGLLREDRSSADRLVRLSRECNRGQGAQPYYAVRYYRSGGKVPQVSKYTPFGNRAEFLFARFCEDVTDAAALAPVPQGAAVAAA